MTEQSADPVRYLKLQVWTRTDSDGESWTVYKLPDGTEYRGDVYARIDGADDRG
jgi:hypothetical protein